MFSDEKFDCETLNNSESTKEDEAKDPDPPEDRFYFIYIFFFLLGFITFFQWSFYTTALKYWMYKFRNTTSNETNSEFRTDLQATFSATLATTLQISEVIFLSVATLLSRFFRVRPQMITAFTIITIFFVLITAFTKINTDSWQEEFFIMVMVIASVVDAVNAFLTITGFTIISQFPESYLGFYVSGGALSRVISSGFQVIALAFGLSTVDSALLYFSMGTTMVVLILLMFILSGWNKFYQHYMKKFCEGTIEKGVTLKEGLKIVTKIWSSMLMVGISIIAQDAAPTALVVSENEGKGLWNDVYFIPVITFLLTAVCDLIGRAISFKFAPKLSSTLWVILTLAKALIFFPLFVFSNAQPRHHLKVLLPHDYQYIILIIVANISGGYFYARASFNIQQLVAPEDLKHAYHILMVSGAGQMAIFSFFNILVVKLL